MSARWTFGSLWLFLSCWAVAGQIDGQLSDVSMPWRRLLQAADQGVSSPDVALNGACAADVMLHCQHLLHKDATVAAATKARLSKAIVAATQLKHASSVAKQAGSASKRVSVGVSGLNAGAKQQLGAGKTASQKGAAAVAGSAGAGSQSTSTAAATAHVTSTSGQVASRGSAAAAGAGGQAATVGSSAVATGAAAGAATGGAVGTVSAAVTAQGTAAGAAKAAAGAGAAQGAGGAGAATTAGGAAGAVTRVDAAAAGSAAGTAQRTQAGVGSGTSGAAAAALQGAGTDQAKQASAGTAAVAANQQQHSRHLLAGDAAAATAQATAQGAGGAATAAGGGGGAHAAAAGSAGGEGVAAKAALAELNAAESQQDDLSHALQLLGLRSDMSPAVMAIASAPIARCLRGVMQASEMSINPNIPDVADECKAEVRSVLIKRASDARYDPPLLAACAHDIVNHCDHVGQDSASVLGCLKSVKPRLLPHCRTAVTSRQAAAAEDLSLDPDLQRHCGAERDKLCLEAGWGNGAAQACLLGHLRGSLPQVFSRVVFVAPEGGDAAPGATAANPVELSANCSAALVGRLMEEGEDIRFNYRLSSACAGDKQLLCRDVRPGGAAVLRCLEDHMESADMTEECRAALSEFRLVRSVDVRLDHTFVSGCDTDVRSLCPQEMAEELGGGAAEVPFGLSAPFECLRGRLDLVREPTCRRHMYELIVAAYGDNRLDAGLMRSCHQEVAVFCAGHPARALDCLRDKIEMFSREDSPAVLKGKFSDICMSVVADRHLQAATDVAFVPDLMQACAREHAAFCSGPDMQGVRGLDCLADRRASPDFSPRCASALRDFLVEAATDVRTMAGLRQDCSEEVATMCKGVQPGEGRVISCLRDNRANITGEACRRQLLRLLGLQVEDHRLDSRMQQACTSDIQKYCGGVEAADGQVHACLRRSADHLSPECRAAEEEVERLEHEDVRLNPRLMRECPLAVSTFCADVPPGDARVIGCLQSNMDKGHFPPACRAALRQLTDRAALKYSLNYRLRRECQEDAEVLCPDSVDEASSGLHSVTGKGGAHSQETTLACLARQPAKLGAECRAELQSLVKLSLNRYRVGMPLTSQCDGDVMARCQVDKVAAPFLESGFVLGCLAKHASKLHKPCWELVSTMDETQFKRAATAESTAWRAPGAAVLDEALVAKLAADVRREIEPRLTSSMQEQIHRNVHVVARNVSGALVRSLAPKVNALMHTTATLLGLTGMGLVGAVLLVRRVMARGGVMVVKKDGRV